MKVSGASHMVGFDVPDVAHDLILRFMGVDFSTLVSGSSPKIHSSLGEVNKPESGESKSSATPQSTAAAPVSTGLTEQDKARWEGKPECLAISIL